ncbi:MAG: hypothetical protein JWN02_41 [Acidobacteria bacterium]|nr:hypothetical protein [Acidobacteriota bacterium]
MRYASVRLFPAFAFAILAAAWGAFAGSELSLVPSTGGSQHVTFVPWKVLNPGDERPQGDLILYWLPASREEIRHSPLVTSRPLAVYSTQCVSMQLVRPEDQETIARLEAEERLPAAVLTDREGRVIARVEADHGLLRLSAVEKMVREEIALRDAAADRTLDDARSRLEAGDAEGASALYRTVCDARCLFPRKAREAEKALKRLASR